MHDTSNPRDASNTGTTMLGFALGAVVGAGLALLLAPDSGKNTRQRLASTARRLSRSAEHTFVRARETAADLGADARSAIKAGQDSFAHDRAARELNSERRMSPAGDTAPRLNKEGQNV